MFDGGVELTDMVSLINAYRTDEQSESGVVELTGVERVVLLIIVGHLHDEGGHCRRHTNSAHSDPSSSRTPGQEIPLSVS